MKPDRSFRDYCVNCPAFALRFEVCFWVDPIFPQGRIEGDVYAICKNIPSEPIRQRIVLPEKNKAEMERKVRELDREFDIQAIPEPIKYRVEAYVDENSFSKINGDCVFHVERCLKEWNE